MRTIPTQIQPLPPKTCHVTPEHPFYLQSCFLCYTGGREQARHRSRTRLRRRPPHLPLLLFSHSRHSLRRPHLHRRLSLYLFSLIPCGKITHPHQNLPILRRNHQIPSHRLPLLRTRTTYLCPTQNPNTLTGEDDAATKQVAPNSPNPNLPSFAHASPPPNSLNSKPSSLIQRTFANSLIPSPTPQPPNHKAPSDPQGPGASSFPTHPLFPTNQTGLVGFFEKIL